METAAQVAQHANAQLHARLFLLQFGRWRGEVVDTNATGLRLMLPEDAECALGVGDGVRCVAGTSRTPAGAWVRIMSSQPALRVLHPTEWL